jgi:hypothetical protein
MVATVGLEVDVQLQGGHVVLIVADQAVAAKPLALLAVELIEAHALPCGTIGRRDAIVLDRMAAEVEQMAELLRTAARRGSVDGAAGDEYG